MPAPTNGKTASGVGEAGATLRPNRRLDLSVQYASGAADLPQRAQIRAWARAALDIDERCGGIVTVRFVDADEGRTLNREYRGKDYATNVLSFPYAETPRVEGDLVICAPVVAREANEQGKPLTAHYAHLVVHGLLHLRGYDHETGAADAERMEQCERAVLATLGFPDPYREPSGGDAGRDA